MPEDSSTPAKPSPSVILTKCTTCSGPIHRARKVVGFAVGQSPIHYIELVLEAEWCDRPKCYHKVKIVDETTV